MKLFRIFHIVAIILLIGAVSYLFKSVDDLRTELAVLRTVKGDSVISTNFDFFMGKIDSNFNLTLTTITVICGFFLLLSFTMVREYITHEIEKWKNEISDIKKSLNVHVENIKNLEGDVSYDNANFSHSSLKEYHLEKPEDFIKYIELSLVICEGYSKSLYLKSKLNTKFENATRGIIKSLLQTNSELISDKNKVELIHMGYERYLRIQDNIHKIADKEDKQNLALIFSKLEFPDLD